MASGEDGARVALITGAAHRLGAATAARLHAAGFRVLLHANSSLSSADALARALCGSDPSRPDSARALKQDLRATGELPSFIQTAAEVWGRLDVLVNNAAAFYATDVRDGWRAEIDEHWEDLMSINLRAPFTLSVAAFPFLRERTAAGNGGGTSACIVNIIDTHHKTPDRGFAVYTVTKAALEGATVALAKEFAPYVRVNGVSPGVMLWPGEDVKWSEEVKREAMRRVPMGRLGGEEAVAGAVGYLVDADYVTGEVVRVDGGRHLD